MTCMHLHHTLMLFCVHDCTQEKTGLIDYDKLEETSKLFRPKVGEQRVT